MEQPLLRIENLTKTFIKRGFLIGNEIEHVQAVDDVSFSLSDGEILGIVGESGCGKSTLVRCILKLIDPTSGSIIFQGEDITRLSRADMHPFRRQMMMVFQDPYGSLNQRKRVGEIVGDPLAIYNWGSRSEIKERVQHLLELVGLNPEHYNRYPHEFSGGQRQRIGIARALALEPKLLVCDEPTSALDVSVQAQILNLLAELQQKMQLSILFITHNLEVIRHVADRVIVMYLGKVIESGSVDNIFNHPHHPYTASLLSAVPIPNPRLARKRIPIILEGDPPSPLNPPKACKFHPRCPRAQPVCSQKEPPEISFTAGHKAYCYFPIDEWPLKSIETLRNINGLTPQR
jgi:oligopeptide transport system ATP-binding protein